MPRQSNSLTVMIGQKAVFFDICTFVLVVKGQGNENESQFLQGDNGLVL